MLVGAVGIEITISRVLKDLRNVLRNRKKQPSSVGNSYCCLKAASFFDSHPPLQKTAKFTLNRLPLLTSQLSICASRTGVLRPFCAQVLPQPRIETVGGFLGE